MTGRVAHSVTATPDPPPKGVPNPVHRADGARAAGYQAPLVAGVRTYGWAVGAIVEAAGAEWMDGGWIDFSLHRPVFAGDRLTTTVTSTGAATGAPDARWDVATVVEPERIVLMGEVGVGSAPWLTELDAPPASPGSDPPPARSTYDVASAPVGRALLPLAAFVTGSDAEAMLHDDLAVDPEPFCRSGRVRLHPYFLAGRMAPLTRHNFTYGPTIHVRSQIQHCAPAWADQEITVGARVVDAYERNGHQYQVLDGRITGAGADDLVLIRHHTIFRPRGTVPPEPDSSAAPAG